jgi:hypothetical protein
VSKQKLEKVGPRERVAIALSTSTTQALMRETKRELADVLEILKISKQPATPCCFCSQGHITLGRFMGLPLAWHSLPHCAGYQSVPNTTAGVCPLWVRLGAAST